MMTLVKPGQLPPPAPKMTARAAAAAMAKVSTPAASDGAKQSNTDFIVEHMLKKCDSMASAKKFFDWLKTSNGNKMRGRVFTRSDVMEAEKRCKEVWNGAKQPAPKAKQPVLSTPSGADSGLSAVEVITRHIL